jgi:hypothetical protein
VQHSEFLNLDYTQFSAQSFAPAVIQRSEIEVGGNEGTFFITTEADYEYFKTRIEAEDSTTEYMISPFISGDSVSMAGCVTAQGVLTGALQLQFIDVPESLHGTKANGIFFGNDWGYKTWTDDIQKEAEQVVETIGMELQKEGFMGIFGIDFMYDPTANTLYPLECNPRITGSMPAHSLMLLSQQIPPFEYYHLLALTSRDTTFDFAKANHSLKTTIPCSHISFSPIGIETMTLPLVAGVYAYDTTTDAVTFERPGFHYDDIKYENEFIIIDAIPQLGEKIQQHVPGFFKFLFKEQIAQSSHEITERAQKLINIFTHNLKNPPLY